MARLVIGGCIEGKEVYFEDKEIQEIISLCDPYDRYAVEQEMEKRAEAQRVGEDIHIHIYTIDPFMANACVGNPREDWWI